MSLLDFVDGELAALEERSRRRHELVVGARAGADLVLDGRRLSCFSSNDYLGLADHPALVAAATAAMHERGVGAGASRLISGNLDLTVALEDELARVHGVEAARVMNSGYAANTGLVPVLVEKDDVIFSDELNHASLIDGCRLSRARVVVYRHADLDHLHALLSREVGRRRLVVTESVFSMDGDRAPLGELCQLARAHDAITMVDDAHAVAALDDGRGLGVAAGADVVVGTLGKAYGVFGAFVLGRRSLVELLWNRARPLVFSTGLPVPVVAAALESVRLCAGPLGDERRAALRERIERVQARLGGSDTPVFPLWVGDDRRAMECARWLAGQGFFVQGIRPPTVPEGSARLRLSLSAAQPLDAVDGLLDAVGELEKRGWIGRDGARAGELASIQGA